ncbi:unnamed protein product, partial [Menidia menidia]
LQQGLVVGELGHRGTIDRNSHAGPKELPLQPVPEIESKMAAILRVVLGEDNVVVLDLPNGIPPELEDLKAEIKRQHDLSENFRLQFRDARFDSDFVNLSSTSLIKDRSTVKVIYVANESGTTTRDGSLTCPANGGPSGRLLQESDDTLSSASDRHSFLCLILKFTVVHQFRVILEVKAMAPNLHYTPVNAEFTRITTKPLVSTFMFQLDHYTDPLLKTFRKKGGTAGLKITGILAAMGKDVDPEAQQTMNNQLDMVVYVIQHEGAEPTDDPG